MFQPFLEKNAVRILLFPENGFLVALIAQGGWDAQPGTTHFLIMNSFINIMTYIIYVTCILYVYMYVYIYCIIALLYIITLDTIIYYSWFKSSLQCYSLQNSPKHN